jgi:organic hydroperoxide reductase OsmC/OhrA
MMSGNREHRYSITVGWTGNLGSGTSGYRAYSRNHEIRTGGKAFIPGSSDPAFQGDASRWNPEELLVASLSTCHQLWYLHLAAEEGITVTAYADQAEGLMEERPDGSGRFAQVTLRPSVTVTAGTDMERANALHHVAHEKCFIANSVNFPVSCEPKIIVAEQVAGGGISMRRAP